MSTSVSRFSLVSAILVLTIGAGLTLRGADPKSPAAEKKSAPAKNKAAAEKKNDGDKKSAEAKAKGAPLKLTFDSKPINRESSDRVSYAPIVKRTAASVVYVYSSKRVRTPDYSSLFNDPRFRRFFDALPGMPRGEDGEGPTIPNPRNTPRNNPRNAPANPRGRSPDQTQQGLGSGVIITKDGYILTNNHVIEDADDVKVSIGESTKRYDAKVVGRDAFADLAVLKIEADNLTAAVIGDSEQLEVGDVVLAIGNPFGVGQSVSRGIVSALSRGVGIGPIEDFIQTDAAINPGNSGGALLDTEGRLVGINTAILSRSGGFAGVGFAIPVNLARNIAEQIVNTGRVDRGFLGVAPQDLTEDLVSQFGTEKGALISEVTEGSPAEKAGLKAGDVIVKVQNSEVRDSRQLLLTVGQFTPGTTVAVEYLRDGKTRTAQVKLARRPDQPGADSTPETAEDIGVLNGVGVGEITEQVREQLQLPPRIKGALITSIDADSPSARQGLREGDIILELDRKPVIDADSAVKLSEEIKGPKVLVLIWRDGRTRYLAVDESKE
jgi:serine protease Do